MATLYDKQLRVLLNKPQDRVLELSDGNGLGARVSQTGKIRWQFRYKIQGKNKRLDLGNYPELSISGARDKALQCRQWLVDGHDPKLQRDLQRKTTLQPVSVKEALEYWIINYAEEKRVNAERHRKQFERHIYPYIGHYPLEQTETRHWLECFDRIRKGIKGRQRPAPVAAGYTLQNAKQALRFCRVRRYAISRELDDLMITDVGQKQRRKDRVLSQIELADVWLMTQSDFLPEYYRHLIKLLCIFGARSQEVRLSQWDEWDLEAGLWVVPKMHSKSRAKIIRPIPTSLLPWLSNYKADAKASDLILRDDKSPEAVSQYCRFLWKRLGHVESWSLHDIRRTFATRLNELSVMPHVVEQLLGHVMPGMMAIYNRSQYIPEKKAALDMWIERLDLMANTDDKVHVL